MEKKRGWVWPTAHCFNHNAGISSIDHLYILIHARRFFFFFCPLSSFFGFFIDFSLTHTHTHTHTHTPGQPRELNPGLQGELQRLIDDQDRAQAAACDGTAAVAPWVDGHFDSLPPYWYLCPYYHYWFETPMYAVACSSTRKWKGRHGLGYVEDFSENSLPRRWTIFFLLLC